MSADLFKFPMKSVSIITFVLALACAEAAVRVANRISPELEPTSSDKKFFGKDYPYDKRAVVDKHYVFDHPYPAVQDSNDFDKDFVKDENSDGGKWAAQMNYDTLRWKIRQAAEELAKLKEKMEKEYDEWQRAKKAGATHNEGLEAARKAVEDARRAAEAAAKRVNDLEGSSDGTPGGAIGRAIADVNKEMRDLEDCKKALAEAKEKLKEILAKQAEEEKEKKKEEEEKEKKTKEDEQKKEEEDKHKKEDDEKKHGAKEEGGKESKEKEEHGKDDDEDDEHFKKEIEKDTQKASDWRKNYLKELEDVRRTEKELEAAADTLRKYRRPPFVDDNGGVYNEPRSFATMHAPAGLLVMLLAMTFIVRP